MVVIINIVGSSMFILVLLVIFLVCCECLMCNIFVCVWKIFEMGVFNFLFWMIVFIIVEILLLFNFCCRLLNVFVFVLFIFILVKMWLNLFVIVCFWNLMIFCLSDCKKFEFVFIRSVIKFNRNGKWCLISVNCFFVCFVSFCCWN